MRLWLIKRIRRPDSEAAVASIEPIMMTESNECMSVCVSELYNAWL